MDETKQTEFVEKAVEDVGALLGGAMVVIGDKLGLYRAMAGAGPLTPAELAGRTGTAERYVREWSCAQAARGYRLRPAPRARGRGRPASRVRWDKVGRVALVLVLARGYLTYHGAGRFSLPDEHAIPLTDETSPASVIGAFEIAVGSVYATDTIAERVRTGTGFPWGAHDAHVLGGCERLDSSAGWRRGQAHGRRPRRRHRLRPRRIDTAARPGLPCLQRRRLRRPPGLDRRRA